MSRGRDKFKKFSSIIMFLVRLTGFLPLCMLKQFLSFFQQTKGTRGLVIRYILLKCICLECGDNVSVHPNVYLFYPERLSLGNNVSIHPMCYIDAVGNISIGNDVSIAHGATILSSSHNYQRLDVPIKDQGLTTKKTIIEDNVWIGAKATVLYGITVETGSIIGANSVVTKNINSNTIVAGVPAAIVNTRVMEKSKE